MFQDGASRCSAMSELQATVEFCVELYKFYNVDLFQRGLEDVLGICSEITAKLVLHCFTNIGVGSRFWNKEKDKKATVGIENEVTSSQAEVILVTDSADQAFGRGNQRPREQKRREWTRSSKLGLILILRRPSNCRGWRNTQHIHQALRHLVITGFYQVRTALRVSPKLPVKIEVNLPRNQR
uniref:Uncharacterized protein n=1 Tax=Timema monikensis TaxID=170555 RepID=A0A7R9EIP2_9NEOP|nr:unnamed protein product [Timema monikensis]